MVSADMLTEGTVPFSGESISTSNIGSYVVGTVMILAAVKGGSFIINYLQGKLGVSQDTTSLRVV